jgi:Fe-S-cluster containining protein
MSHPPEDDDDSPMQRMKRVLSDPLFDVPLAAAPTEDRPVCTTCGLCCIVPGYRHLTADDVWALIDHLDCDLETLRRDYLNADGPLSLRAPCAFLTRSPAGYHCGVYAARPSLCREFAHCTVLQNDPPDAPQQIAAARQRWARYDAAVSTRGSSPPTKPR